MKDAMPAPPPRSDDSTDRLARESPILHAEIRRWWVVSIMGWAERTAIRLRLSPNTLTVAGLGLVAVCGVLFATGHILSAGWAVLFAGSFDFLDGRVARATNRVTKQGAFLDSALDRYQDFLLLAGLCWFFRHSFVLAVVLLALGGSMTVSYVRAKADSLGIDLGEVGSMQRPERLFLLGFGSIVSSALQVSLMPFYGKGNPPAQHLLIAVLLFLALSTNLTAVRRIRHTMRSLAGQEKL